MTTETCLTPSQKKLAIAYVLERLDVPKYPCALPPVQWLPA